MSHYSFSQHLKCGLRVRASDGKCNVTVIMDVLVVTKYATH